MQNIEIVQALEPNGDLNEGLPDKTLFKKLFIFLLNQYLLVQVSIIRKIHHYTWLDTKYQSEFDSIKACLYPTMYGHFTEASILTSFRAFYCSLSERLFILTFFKA